ncbi:MAG: hypothetical protein CO108_21600 [Deltaproteobacteria bacterium CG_4_9_14_3_um_filter_63_12]|nr:MAG: hypothetical protein CO108_21600 [Deltaproteobacteria bacterium CG_4_9_14_3_um_filter_63_12]
MEGADATFLADTDPIVGAVVVVVAAGGAHSAGEVAAGRAHGVTFAVVVAGLPKAGVAVAGEKPSAEQQEKQEEQCDGSHLILVLEVRETVDSF